MVAIRLRCLALEGGALYGNKYTGPSGQTYHFDRGMSTVIKNRQDAESFLKSGDFKLVNDKNDVVTDLKKSLAQVDKVLPKKKEVKEEKLAPKAKEEKKEEPKKSLEDRRAELFKENKKKQIQLIKDLGGTTIPGFERGRVDLIIKLQDKKSKGGN